MLSKAGNEDGKKTRIVKCGYTQLKIVHYFTTGEKEVRCWTVGQGSTALLGTIVTLFQYFLSFVLQALHFSD